MKTAKEWAESVVVAVMTEDHKNNSVERLVERVQVDAQAPLEEEIAALKTRVAELEEELDHHNALERSERDV